MVRSPVEVCVGRGRGPEEAFILTAMLSLLGGFGGLALHPALLEGHFYRQPLFGFTHVLTLGWVSLLIQGVLLRLSPMLLGTPPPGNRLGIIVWVLWVVGASGMVSHMFRGEWFGVWTAALALLAASVLLPVQHRELIRRAREGDPIARYAALAMGNLILAASMGVFIGINKHLRLVPVSPGALLGLHFHLAEVGWVTFMVLGFGRKLLPPLTPVPESDPRASRRRLLALEVGLLLVSVGFLAGRGVLWIGTCLLGAAVLHHLARPIGRLVRGRVRDRASVWTTVALVFLAVDTLLGLVLAFGIEARLPWPRDRLLYAYGVIALVGWNTLVITSLGLKLFPLWVWRERFEADWGVRPVPKVSDLYLRGLQEFTGLALTGGCLILVAGILEDAPRWTAWGMRLCALGVLSFVLNFLRVSRWALFPLEYRPPGTGPTGR